MTPTGPPLEGGPRPTTGDTVADTMQDRVRLALDLAPAGTVPPRFEAAYRRGGTPTSVHRTMLAEAANTTPRWLMTGLPAEHAPSATGRKTTMPEQNDQPDEQRDDEPTVAHYQRADADRMPTHPAGQQAAVEGMLAAQEHADRPRPSVDDLLARARLDHSRDVPAEPPVSPAVADHNRRRLARHLERGDTPTARLMADVLDLLNRHEREQAAARAANGDSNPYDLDPLEPVHDLANYYAEHRDDEAALAAFYDQLAAELDLADIRALRLAGEAVVAATPRAIKAARDHGMKPPRIADMLGLTPSRVYQVLRELDAQQPPADGDQ